jgi:hypothetical protein
MRAVVTVLYAFLSGRCVLFPLSAQGYDPVRRSSGS